MVECQRLGEMVAVLPWLSLAAVDVVVIHTTVKAYAAQAVKQAVLTVARAEQTKRI